MLGGRSRWLSIEFATGYLVHTVLSPRSLLINPLWHQSVQPTPIGKEPMAGHTLLLRPGETLMVAGDKSNDVFRLHRGLLDVLVAVDGQEQTEAAQIRPGGLVGELAALAGTPRTATVVAVDESEVTAYSLSLIHISEPTRRS